MKKFLIIIGVLILLTLFPLYQLYAISLVEIQSLKIEKITLDHSLQFILVGTAEVYNPSLVPVTIKQFAYTGIIKNEKVLEGARDAMTIPARESVTLPFTAEMTWVPDTETALDILAGKKVTLTLKIEAEASYLYFFTITGTKKVEISLSTFLKPYVEEQLATITKKLSAFL